jgi:hypothetical protein
MFDSFACTRGDRMPPATRGKPINSALNTAFCWWPSRLRFCCSIDSCRRHFWQKRNLANPLLVLAFKVSSSILTVSCAGLIRLRRLPLVWLTETEESPTHRLWESTLSLHRPSIVQNLRHRQFCHGSWALMESID